MQSESTNSRIGRTRKLLKVVNMSTVTGNAPQVSASGSSDKWVRFGKSNMFPEFLRSLADNCPPLNASINTFALYLAGRRLIFRDANGEEVARASEAWNSLHRTQGEAHFRKSIAKDIALLGARSIEVIRSVGGGIAQVNHLDDMRVRIAKRSKDSTRIEGFYFCSNWERRTGDGGEYPAIYIPAYGTRQADEAGKGILYAKEYHQGQDYYGMPIYLPALTDAEVFARIAQFNRTQLDTGFRPAFHIHAIVPSKDDENVEELDENIEEVFTGPDGKSYALTTGTRDEAPIITKLERGDHAGELDEIGDRAANVIYDAFGIPRVLMGVEIATGLSGKGLALEQSVTQFLRTQIIPRQYLITDDALWIVQQMGISEAVSCEVDQLLPFDQATDGELQRMSYLRRTMVFEDRIANGQPILTTDGKEPKEDRSNWDPRMTMLLIEAGMNKQAEGTQPAPANA